MDIVPMNRILATKTPASASADTSALEAQIDALVYRLYGRADGKMATTKESK